MSEEDDLSEWIDKHVSAMRIDDLIARVPANCHLALGDGLRAAFDLPKVDGAPEKALRDLLAIYRLNEDFRPDPKAARREVVALLADAVSGSLKVGTQATPVAPIETSLPQGAPVSAADTSPAEKSTPPQAPVSGEAADVKDGAAQDLVLVMYPNWSDRPALHDDYLASLVPGPGAQAGETALGSWVSGQPADETSFAIGHGVFSADDFERMVDMEAEFLSNPADTLLRHDQTMARSKPLVFPHRPSGNAALAQLARTYRGEPRPDIVILKTMRDALAEVLQQYWPEKAQAIAKAGSVLRVGPKLMARLRLADALEQEWIAQSGGAPLGSRQDMRGTINPDGAMPAGLVFKRMGYLHFACGWPAEDCLFEALSDRRYAEAIRGLDDDATRAVSESFDASFLADPAAELPKLEALPQDDLDPTPSL